MITVVQPFVSKWPLVVLIVIHALSFVVCCQLHGKKNESKYNIGTTLLSNGIIFTFLSLSGFFCVINWNQLLMLCFLLFGIITAALRDGKMKGGHHNALIDTASLLISAFLILVWYIPTQG